jgi:hypothetical protein
MPLEVARVVQTEIWAKKRVLGHPFMHCGGQVGAGDGVPGEFGHQVDAEHGVQVEFEPCTWRIRLVYAVVVVY